MVELVLGMDAVSVSLQVLQVRVLEPVSVVVAAFVISQEDQVCPNAASSSSETTVPQSWQT